MAAPAVIGCIPIVWRRKGNKLPHSAPLHNMHNTQRTTRRITSRLLYCAVFLMIGTGKLRSFQYDASSSLDSPLLLGNSTGDKNRLFCLVPFIWSPKYLPSYDAIHATWGKRCDTLRCMIDPIIGDEQIGYYNMTLDSDVLAAKDAFNVSLPDDVVVLHDMQRPWHTCRGEEAEKNGNCRNIWEKVWRSLRWINNDGGDAINSADWFVKVDSDTFLFPDNAKHYVKQKGWSPDDYHTLDTNYVILPGRTQDSPPSLREQQCSSAELP